MVIRLTLVSRALSVLRFAVRQVFEVAVVLLAVGMCLGVAAIFLAVAKWSFVYLGVF